MSYIGGYIVGSLETYNIAEAKKFPVSNLLTRDINNWDWQLIEISRSLCLNKYIFQIKKYIKI